MEVIRPIKTTIGPLGVTLEYETGYEDAEGNFIPTGTGTMTAGGTQELL